MVLRWVNRVCSDGVGLQLYQIWNVSGACSPIRQWIRVRVATGCSGRGTVSGKVLCLWISI